MSVDVVSPAHAPQCIEVALSFFHDWGGSEAAFGNVSHLLVCLASLACADEMTCGSLLDKVLVLESRCQKLEEMITRTNAQAEKGNSRTRT